MKHPLKVGDQVTSEPRYWYDGTPIAGWPRPEYVETVTETGWNYGLPIVWTRKPGRKHRDIRNAGDFLKIERTPSRGREKG